MKNQNYGPAGFYNDNQQHNVPPTGQQNNQSANQPHWQYSQQSMLPQQYMPQAHQSNPQLRQSQPYQMQTNFNAGLRSLESYQVYVPQNPNHPVQYMPYSTYIPQQMYQQHAPPELTNIPSLAEQQIRASQMPEIPSHTSIFPKSLVRCTFIVKLPFPIDSLQFAVFLVGSVKQLGSWQPRGALKLSNPDRQGLVWQTSCELEADSLIEYKYITQSLNVQGANFSVNWEQLPANRILNTHNKQEVRLIEVWNNSEGSNEDSIALKLNFQSPVIEAPLPKILQQENLSVKSIGARSSLSPVSQVMPHPDSARTSSFSKQLHMHNRNQNRLASSSDASFINEDNTGFWPIEQSMFATCENTPNQKTYTSTLHQIQAPTVQQVPAQQLQTSTIDTPALAYKSKMNKALQNAFKDFITLQTKEELNLEEGTEEQHEKAHAHVEKVSESPSHSTGVEIDPQEPVVHVSYMLPYKLTKSARKPDEFIAVQCYHNPTFLYGTLDHLGSQGTFNFYWVGILSTETKLSEEEEKQAREVLKQKKCFPVFVTLKEIQNFLIYYESLIKPKMHNFVDLKDDSRFITDNWHAYVSINQKIAQKVIEVRSMVPNVKAVWVHGDHLMLVPQYVRKQFQSVNLGLYFHSAFPASAIFKSLYYRRDLLHSLLQADLIGFHLFEYARNFLNTCSRLFNLNLDYSNGGFMSVNYHGRIVGVRVSHIGIDESFIQRIMNGGTYKKEVDKFKEEFNQITELARKSNLQSQGGWSRSSANMIPLVQNRLGGGRNSGRINQMSSGISTSQSSNSLRTLIESEVQESNVPQSFDKPIVISSIDTFTPLSGFKTKLKGYQKFLQSYPNYRNKTVLIQFMPSIFCNSDISKQKSNEANSGDNYLTDSISIFKDLQTEIIKITEEIHKEFGPHCLILQEGNPPLAKRLAVWSQSQILMIATLKDGLCMPPLEFVTVKKILNDFHNSSMILSEFSGCSNAFSGFHSFNSFDLKELVQALDSALSTPSTKKAEMMQRAYTYSSRRGFQKWVEAFLKDLKQMYNPTQTVASRYIYLGLMTAAATQKGGEKVISTALDIEQCVSKFGKCHRCLILIDHEALPRKQFGRGEMQPTDQTIEDLAVITQDSRNTVAILSSESRNYVQKGFSRVPNLWLAAESGYEYRINGQWQTLFKIFDKDWLQILKQMMQEYCDNVDGSYVEERNCTIIWNYKNAEEEHGPMCAKELYLQITQLIGPNAPIEIVQGNGFLEVKPVHLKKTQLLRIFLEELSAQAYSKIDFLLYIGADTSDEPVFKFLKQQVKSKTSKFFNQDCYSNLCILGKKPSKADFYVDEIEKLAILINKIGIETKKRKKSRSYSNLNELQSPVQAKAGLQSAGLSTNDLSKTMFNSLKPQTKKMSKGLLPNKVDFPLTILEREASEEESNINFAESIRSPMSGSLDPHSISSQKNPIHTSQSQNFTFAPDNRENRVFSATEEALSASHSYSRDRNDNLSPVARHGERLVKQSDRPAHDQSMPQLTANKEQIALVSDRQEKHAVAQQIQKVMKEETKLTNNK